MKNERPKAARKCAKKNMAHTPFLRLSPVLGPKPGLGGQKKPPPNFAHAGEKKSAPHKQKQKPSRANRHENREIPAVSPGSLARAVLKSQGRENWPRARRPGPNPKVIYKKRRVRSRGCVGVS